MKFLLSCCVFAILSLLVIGESPLRLIQFNETTIVKMTQEQVHRLANQIGEEVHFADITETSDLGLGEVPKVSQIPDSPRHQAIVNSLISKLTEAGLRANIEKLSSFHTRYYLSQTGKDAADWLYSTYSDAIKKLPEQRRKLFSVQYFNHTWLQPSVIARIQGKSEEIVVIGAHEDSINGQTGRSPGSDDNASGTSTVLEVWRAIANSSFMPNKTIEVHHYAAEEVGLRGSRDVANAYKNAKKAVFSMINMDMTGFNAGQNTVGVATDYVDAATTSFLRKLVNTYSGLKQGDIRCNYACSDHASFTSAGYRSSHIFEASPIGNMNRNIHTARDTIDRLDLKRAVELIKVALSFVVELSH